MNISTNKSQRGLHAQSADLKEFSQVCQEWFCDIAPDVSIDTVIKPQFWVHHARLLKKNNIIVCKAEDGAWIAWLLVESDGGPEVIVKQISYTRLDNTSPVEAIADTHFVDWRGPHAQFCIVNRATKQIIKDKLYPKETAVKFLNDQFRKAS